MKRFVNITPSCDLCHSELVLTNFQIDLANCLYALFCECVCCGNDQILLLSLEDFCEINRLIYPPDPPKYGGLN
jgi:hypothetical protein